VGQMPATRRIFLITIFFLMLTDKQAFLHFDNYKEIISPFCL
jgi:hypothetical protein